MTATTTERRTPLRILHINSSARIADSTTRALGKDVVSALAERHGQIEVTNRDLAKGLPFVDEDWVSANFTAVENRNEQQQDTLAYSDGLVAEIEAADVIVIGVPDRPEESSLEAEH